MRYPQDTLPWSKVAVAGLVCLSLAIAGCQQLQASEDSTPSSATDVAQANAPVRVGSPAPDFTATDSNGNTVKLSDYKGKVVVLEWTNHDCPFVRKHYNSNNMQELQTEATSQDVAWLSIISSAPGKQGYVEAEKANELTASRNASPTAVLLDPEGSVGRLYSARTTPHLFVIDREGTLQYMGAIDDTPTADKADVETATNYVQPAIASVLSGEAVATAVTQPYGCSVKY